MLARLIDDRLDLAAESAALHERRELLLAAGIAARAAAFTSSSPGDDAVRMAAELDCDLMLIDAPRELLDSPVLQAILTAAPCDVAALVGGEPAPGPLLVPFVGAEHDWTAIELGAWLAGAWQVPLRLAGPSVEGARLKPAARERLTRRPARARRRRRTAAPRPRPGGAGARRPAAPLVVVGLSDRWQKEGLGTARAALAQLATTRRAARPPRAAAWRSRAARKPHPLHLVAQAPISLNEPKAAGRHAGTAGTSRSAAARWYGSSRRSSDRRSARPDRA